MSGLLNVVGAEVKVIEEFLDHQFDDYSIKYSVEFDEDNIGVHVGACGCHFLEFLCNIDIHYFAGKVKADDYFDLDATISAWKNDIIEYRRMGELRRELARNIFDEIKYIDENCTSEQDVIHALRDADKLMRWHDGMPSMSRSITPGFRQFWANIWPHFISHIKAEFTLEPLT